VLAEHPDENDRSIADRVQDRLVVRIADRFRPIFEKTGGRWGYVSIQGPPENDSDGEQIWGEAVAGHALGPNVAPKIPATLPGMTAFERVVERGWPVIVTEVFSLDQLVSFCELYVRVTERTGARTPFFLSPITGILGDHLKKLARADNMRVSDAMLEQAGIGLARRCAALVKQRMYPVTLLFGGSRIQEDLTGLVGGPHCATINWSTFAEVSASNPPLETTLDRPLDPDVERALVATFTDVWKGWELGRLDAEEYEAFGPVQHFRDGFVAGRRAVLSVIADRRAAAVQR
jgi:transaldolase